jgi:hypothetical protein
MIVHRFRLRGILQDVDFSPEMYCETYCEICAQYYSGDSDY